MTTLTTVGYGDISPMAEGGVGGTHATFEIVVTLFVEMASAIVFGYIIGSLTSILSREDRSRVMLSEKIDEITSYMNSRGYVCYIFIISYDLRLNYFNAIFNDYYS